MSRIDELRDTLIVGDREGRGALRPHLRGLGLRRHHQPACWNTRRPARAGSFAAFAKDATDHGWHERLDRVAEAMIAAHGRVLDNRADIDRADAFVHERILGARNCLIDLQRLCSYSHFRLSEHMDQTRELLSGLGEAHSAFVTTLLAAARRA